MFLVLKKGAVLVLSVSNLRCVTIQGYLYKTKQKCFYLENGPSVVVCEQGMNEMCQKFKPY